MSKYIRVQIALHPVHHQATWPVTQKVVAQVPEHALRVQSTKNTIYAWDQKSGTAVSQYNVVYAQYRCHGAAQ